VSALIRDVEHFAEAVGRRPRLLAVALGPEADDCGTRVLATAFADIGFDVDIGRHARLPESVARQAIENDVHVIAISGDARLAPALIAVLEARGAEDILVVSGADADIAKAAEILAALRDRAQPTD
jgi:methylmalonyl-CoA mutase